MTTLTLDEIAHQIKKACEIYKRLPQTGPSMLKSYLGKEFLTARELPYLPTAKEIDMADTVHFIWMRFLLPDERRLVWKRYEGKQWKILAYEENLSIRQARYKLLKSLKKIQKELNLRKNMNIKNL